MVWEELRIEVGNAREEIGIEVKSGTMETAMKMQAAEKVRTKMRAGRKIELKKRTASRWLMRMEKEKELDLGAKSEKEGT